MSASAGQLKKRRGIAINFNRRFIIPSPRERQKTPTRINRSDATSRLNSVSLYFYKSKLVRKRGHVVLWKICYVGSDLSLCSSCFLVPLPPSFSPILPPSLFSLLSVVFHPSSIRDSPRKPLPFEVIRISLTVSNRYHPNFFMNNSSFHKILSPR